MADTATTPRIAVAKFKGEQPPGGEPYAWRCNRCGWLSLGFHTESSAYRDAADHECGPEQDRSLCERAAQFAEEVILHGGNGEGWTINDAVLALRVGQGKGLHDTDLDRLRAIAPDLAAGDVAVLEGSEDYR